MQGIKKPLRIGEKLTLNHKSKLLDISELLNGHNSPHHGVVAGEGTYKLI